MNYKRKNTNVHTTQNVFTPICASLVSLILTISLFPLTAIAEINNETPALSTTNSAPAALESESKAASEHAFTASEIDEDKKETLPYLISVVQQEIENIWASDNGSDVESGKSWVPTQTWQTLALALAQGEELIGAQNVRAVSEEELQGAYDALNDAWESTQEELHEASATTAQRFRALSLESEQDTQDTSLSNTGEHAIIETEEGSYVANEMLVTFTENTTRGSAYASLASMEETQNNELAKAISRIDDQDATQAVSVELEEQSSVLDVVQEAKEKSTVLVAQPNIVYYASEIFEENTAADTNTAANITNTYTAQMKPNDPAVASSIPSSNEYREQAWQLYTINAFDAWDYIQTNNSVTVAVLDTGCNLEHEDLKNQILQDYAWNATLTRKLTKDYAGHGTHVAGCVAAEANNGVGTAGASYNARILPICVFDTNGKYCKTNTLVSAYNYLLDYADELNIHVVNMSLGGYGSLSEEDYLLQECIAQAKEKNIASVCAGGNGDENQNPRTDPSYPSDYEDCISVTALSQTTTTPTSWCDYNENKDICAPGQYIYSCSYTNTSSYTIKSGTSMATPIVSGSLALLWALDPTLTVNEATSLIYSTADPLSLTSYQAGREGLYGHGILNIGAAVQKLHTQMNTHFSTNDQPYVANYAYVTYTDVVEDGSVVNVAGAQMLKKGSAWVALVPVSEAQTLTNDDFTFESGTPQTVRTNYDVNNSKRTNIVDAQIIYDLSCGRYTDFSLLSMEDMLAADVTGDNIVDATDAYALQVILCSS